ncbi:MAG: hypothetical protein M3347_14265 [Armatimonadota bacterium]|nr:hypothetical protein [Armatimonadota bacterium]
MLQLNANLRRSSSSPPIHLTAPKNLAKYTVKPYCDVAQRIQRVEDAVKEKKDKNGYEESGNETQGQTQQPT